MLVRGEGRPSAEGRFASLNEGALTSFAHGTTWRLRLDAVGPDFSRAIHRRLL